MEVKSFEEFINTLNLEDKENYNKYSKIRSKYTYVIIYNSLIKKHNRIKYKDVNSLIIYDKAIKDVLYTYLGTFEEHLKSHIFEKFETNYDKKIKKYSDKIDIFQNDNFDKISNLYQKFNLTLGEIKKFLQEKDKNFIDLNKMEKIIDLRNNVMHHKPLLFSHDFISLASLVNYQISNLLELIPVDYKKGLVSKLNYILGKTKKNLNENYHSFLIDKLEP